MEFHQLIANPAFHLIGHQVFSYLDFESLLNASFVCQSWNRFIHEHGSTNWWYKGLKEAKSQFNQANMEFNSLKDWNDLFEKCTKQDVQTVKYVLEMVKACNDHCKSSFWNQGPKQNSNILEFLKNKSLRKELSRFIKVRRPVDVPVLSMNQDHLDLVWNLTEAKNAFYINCFNTIEQYVKDESWTDYKLCKLPTCPALTDHDKWLQKYFIKKIIHEDWRCDQLLIDSVSNGHHELFATMFKLARNKNPCRLPRAPGSHPDSALSRAAGAGDVQALQMILDSVPLTETNKIEAIFAAGLLNRFQCLRYLLDLAKDKNPSRGRQGKTLMHEAASLNCLQTLIIVLSQTGNPNPRDKMGNTPLHQAVLFGHVQTVEWIFQNYPDSIGLINGQGQSPVDLARQNPYRNSTSEHILNILSQYSFH